MQLSFITELFVYIISLYFAVKTEAALGERETAAQNQSLGHAGAEPIILWPDPGHFITRWSCFSQVLAVDSAQGACVIEAPRFWATAYWMVVPTGN